MFLFLFLLVLVCIVLFLYGIWLRYLWIFPIIILFWFLVHWIIKSSIPFFSQNLFRYSLYIAWIFISFSLLWLLSFFWVWFPMSILLIIVLNVLLWLWSYVFDYQDWKKIFQFAYYLFVFVFLIKMFFLVSIWEFYDLLFLILNLHLWFVAFFVFIVWIWYDIDRNVSYNFFVTAICTVFFLIIRIVPSFIGWLALDSLFLTLLYFGLSRFIQHKSESVWTISVRRILAGERVTKKVVFSNWMLKNIFDFVDNMPVFYRYILEFLNIFLVFGLIWYFFMNAGSLNNLNQFLYWFVIAFFVWNVLFLKKISYTSIVQNLFLFVVIYFSLYFSLFSYFEWNLQSMVSWVIFCNIIISWLIFYIPKSKFFVGVFEKIDYRYWIIVGIIAFVINIVLLFKTQLPWELIFFLVLLYIGIESAMVFYGSKFIASLRLGE